MSCRVVLARTERAASPIWYEGIGLLLDTMATVGTIPTALTRATGVSAPAVMPKAKGPAVQEQVPSPFNRIGEPRRNWGTGTESSDATPYGAPCRKRVGQLPNLPAPMEAHRGRGLIPPLCAVLLRGPWGHEPRLSRFGIVIIQGSCLLLNSLVSSGGNCKSPPESQKRNPTQKATLRWISIPQWHTNSPLHHN